MVESRCGERWRGGGEEGGGEVEEFDGGGFEGGGGEEEVDSGV